MLSWLWKMRKAPVTAAQEKQARQSAGAGVAAANEVLDVMAFSSSCLGEGDRLGGEPSPMNRLTRQVANGLENGVL